MPWREEYCVHIFFCPPPPLLLSCVVIDSDSDNPHDENSAKICEISSEGKYHPCLEKQLSSEALLHVAVLESDSANFKFVMLS